MFVFCLVSKLTKKDYFFAIFTKNVALFTIFLTKFVYFKCVPFPLFAIFCLFYTLVYGSTGATGPAGIDAETTIITIGSVTTGAPGTEAAATITGTAPNFILNLTIPQGPTGPAA